MLNSVGRVVADGLNSDELSSCLSTSPSSFTNASSCPNSNVAQHQKFQFTIHTTLQTQLSSSSSSSSSSLKLADHQHIEQNASHPSNNNNDEVPTRHLNVVVNNSNSLSPSSFDHLDLTNSLFDSLNEHCCSKTKLEKVSHNK